MKKIMMLAGLLCLPVATAQTVITLPTLPNFVQKALSPLLPPQRPKLKDVFPAGYDAAEACTNLLIEGDGDLTVNFPARFPDSKRSEAFRSDYRLNCPRFTIERVKEKGMTMIGISPSQLRNLLVEDSYGLPYLLSSGEVELQFGEGDTLLPTVQEGDEPSESVVFAVRQAGTVLQPVVFNGGIQAIAYDRAKPLEIFQKANYRVFWQRMVWDASTRVMVFDIEYPFPKN